MLIFSGVIFLLLLFAIHVRANPEGCGGGVDINTNPPNLYVVPPGVPFSAPFSVRVWGNATCRSVDCKASGALEVTGGSCSCSGGSLTVRAKKDARNATGTISVVAHFSCCYSDGNQTSCDSFDRGASLTLLVDHYVKVVDVSVPSVVLIGNKATVTVTFTSLATVDDVKIWFNWLPSDALIVLANETPGWHNVSLSKGYVLVGKMSAYSKKKIEITFLAAKKGNTTLAFWPSYSGWWDSEISGDNVTHYTLITDVGMEIPDKTLYLTQRIDPYVPVYPNLTTYVYVFTSYKAHVILTTSSQKGSAKINWSKLEFDMSQDEIRKIPIKIEGGTDVITVTATFDSLEPRYPFHYVFSDTVEIKRVAAYLLPPIKVDLNNGTVEVDYVTLGAPKSLYVVFRFLGFVFGESYPVPEEMNTTTVIVPVPPCPAGQTCRASASIPPSPQPNTPGEVLYALRSMKGVVASIMWYDSALGFVESMPVPWYYPYLLVGGAAVELDPKTIRVVIFGYSDAVLKSAKVKLYYWYENKAWEEEFDAQVSENTFLAWRDLNLDANGSYNFIAEVYAKGDRKVVRTLPFSGSTPTEEEVEIKDIPFYGTTQITYNGAPPPEPLPLPSWTQAVLTLALGLAIFAISLTGFLISMRQAPESATEWAATNLAYVVLTFIGIAMASGIFPAVWSFFSEIYGVPIYGDPYHTILLFVSASSFFLSSLASSIVETIFRIGFWTGGLLAVIGGATNLFPNVGVLANLAGSFVFDKLASFVQELLIASSRSLDMILSTASILYLVGLLAGYVFYFVYMLGPLIAVACLALSALPPLRKSCLTLFLFFTFLYAFIPIFTAPAIAILKESVVENIIPALQSLNTGVLSKMGKTLEVLGNVFLNYFRYLFTKSAPPLDVAALALGPIGGFAGLTVFITSILYGMAELYLGIVVAFFTAFGFAEALGGATLNAFNRLAEAGQYLIFKLARRQ